MVFAGATPPSFFHINTLYIRPYYENPLDKPKKPSDWPVQDIFQVPEDFDLDIFIDGQSIITKSPLRTQGEMENRYLDMDLSELFRMIESRSCRITQNDIKQWLDDRRTLVENSLADSKKAEMEAPVDITAAAMEKAKLRRKLKADEEEGGMSVQAAELKIRKKSLKDEILMKESLIKTMEEQLATARNRLLILRGELLANSNLGCKQYEKVNQIIIELGCQGLKMGSERELPRPGFPKFELDKETDKESQKIRIELNQNVSIEWPGCGKDGMTEIVHTPKEPMVVGDIAYIKVIKTAAAYESNRVKNSGAVEDWAGLEAAKTTYRVKEVNQTSLSSIRLIVNKSKLKNPEGDLVYELDTIENVTLAGEKDKLGMEWTESSVSPISINPAKRRLLKRTDCESTGAFTEDSTEEDDDDGEDAEEGAGDGNAPSN